MERARAIIATHQVPALLALVAVVTVHSGLPIIRVHALAPKVYALPVVDRGDVVHAGVLRFESFPIGLVDTGGSRRFFKTI